MQRHLNDLNTNSYETKEKKFYNIKLFMCKFAKIFAVVDWIFLIVLFVLMVFLAVCKVNSGGNYYGFAKEFINLLFGFYSITIGFSLSSLIFLVSNLEKYKSKHTDTLESIVILITMYIILSIVTLISFILLFVIGDYTKNILFPYWINGVVFSFLYINVVFTIYIFIKVVIVIYLYAKNIINF